MQNTMNNSSPNANVSEVGFVALRQNQPASSGWPSTLVAPLCAALRLAARAVPPRWIALWLLLLLAAGPLAAQQMNYQGRLTDANGNAVPDAVQTLRFDIFDAATGGTRLWGTQTNSVDVVQGRFNVVLGPTAPTGGPLGNAFNGGNRFLQITVGNNAPILPRQQMLAAPEALHTLRADSAINAGFATNSGTASVATRSGYATNSGTADFAAVAAAVGSGGSSVISLLGNNVGIGTTTPNAQLSLGSSLANTKLALWDGGGPENSLGFGIQNGQFRLHLLNSAFRYSFLNNAAGTEVMTITGIGRVGIGQPSPRAGLSVNVPMTINDLGTLEQGIHLGSALAAYPDNPALVIAGPNNANANCDLVFASGQPGVWRSITYSRAANAIFVPDGNFGIGTRSPTQAKLVVVGSVNGPNLPANNAYMDQFSHSVNAGIGPWPFSIYADNNVAALRFFAFSDARIKRIEGRSDGASDLATIQGIQVTDYTHIDKIGKGAGKQKKVIAQQVEEVYPQAVTKITDVVPDIYQKATQQNGWVQLATDLKVGDRVKLIGEKEEGIHEVLEVKAGAFRTAFKSGTEKVFVYGREVKDFRSVDYEAISMLNVSATQELARKVKAQESELTDLRAELARLRSEKKSFAATVEDMAARFARLEQAMNKTTPTAAKDLRASADVK